MSAAIGEAIPRGESKTARSAIKVIHVLAPAKFGGLESVGYALASGQRERGHRVSVVALLETGAPEPPLIDRLEHAGVPLFRVTYPARSFGMQRRSLLELCNTEKPDVLHSHGYLPDVLSATLTAKKNTMTRVTTVHGFTGGGARNRTYEWMQRKSFAWLDAVVAVSRKMARELEAQGLRSGLIHTLPNAWTPAAQTISQTEARALLGVVPENFNIGWIGRVGWEKGLDVLIAALPKLTDIPVHLTVIGDGPERAKIENAATEIGVNSRISWKGAIPDAARIIHAFDLLVMSSRTEGTPIVLLEAMGAYVPIVATAVGGIPDVIDQEEGLLVEPENPSSLAQAITSVYENSAAARNRARQARVRLERDFATEPWLERYDAIYKSVSARRA